MNGIYGPRQSMAWYNALMDEAVSFASTLSPDHDTVLRFWPRVLVDKHLHHSSDRDTTGRTGRAEFIKNIPHAFDGILTGQASAQEFFRFQSCAYQAGRDQEHEGHRVDTPCDEQRVVRYCGRPGGANADCKSGGCRQKNAT